MKNAFFSIIAILIFTVTDSTSGQETKVLDKNSSNQFCVETSITDSAYNSQTISLRQDYSKSWQLFMGYSINNSGVTNFEFSYMLPVTRVLAFSADLRLYSFLSLSLSASLFPIQVGEKFSFIFKCGFPIIPLASMGHIGLQCKYKLSSKLNFVLEYKQISTSSQSTGFITFSPDFTVTNYPIRFISVGIEF